MHGTDIKIKKKLSSVLSPELIIIKMNTAYHFPFITMSAIMIELGEVKKLYVLRNETLPTPIIFKDLFS
jgi:hypothetical protein